MTGISQAGNVVVDTRVVFSEFKLFSQAPISEFSQYTFKQIFTNGDYAQFNSGEDGYIYDDTTAPSYPWGTTTQVLTYLLNGGSYSFSPLEMTPSDADRYASMTSKQIAAELLSGDDQIYGSERKDWLDGHGGTDDLYGQGGSDTYVVDRRRDEVFEADIKGVDTVVAKVSYTLAEGLDKFVEILKADSSTKRAIDLDGNDFSNTLIGNNGANVLNGGGGKDTLSGLGGKDTFVFDTAPVSRADASREADVVKGFSSASDEIALSRHDFNRFVGGSFTAGEFHTVFRLDQMERDDRIVYEKRTGYLYADVDGLGGAESRAIARFDNKANISFADFDLVA